MHESALHRHKGYRLAVDRVKDQFTQAHHPLTVLEGIFMSLLVALSSEPRIS
jgi:hypothetical protein